MKEAVFNKIIKLSYPDDFVELTPEENEKYFSGDLLRLTFQNKEKHFILSISKTKDAFMNRFFSTASVLVGASSNLEKNLKEYERIGEYDSTIFDVPAITDCFSYVANDKDIKQYGELTVFKVNKAFYIIYCISRYEDKEDAKKTFKEFKESFEDAI